MNKRVIIVCIAVLAGIAALGQEEWALKVNKEGIEVYTRPSKQSGVKALKVCCVLPATLSQLVAVIMDVNTGADWVYSTKSSFLLKKISCRTVLLFRSAFAMACQ